MFAKFRAKRIMARSSNFELSADRVLNACWRDVEGCEADAQVKGHLAVFCFCVLNGFEILRTFASRQLDIAKSLNEASSSYIAIEIGLLGIARASLDDELNDDFTETIAASHKLLESVGDVEPFCSMSYESFVDHFLPLVNLDPTKAVEVAAARIAKKFLQMPAPLAGVLASSLAMSAASETSRYAEEVMLRVKRQLEQC